MARVMNLPDRFVPGGRSPVYQLDKIEGKNQLAFLWNNRLITGWGRNSWRLIIMVFIFISQRHFVKVDATLCKG